jgi:hypothetical protein
MDENIPEDIAVLREFIAPFLGVPPETITGYCVVAMQGRIPYEQVRIVTTTAQNITAYMLIKAMEAIADPEYISTLEGENNEVRYKKVPPEAN